MNTTISTYTYALDAQSQEHNFTTLAKGSYKNSQS